MKTVSWLRKIGVIALVAGLAVGCASSPAPVVDDSKQAAADAIASAQTAIEDAASMGAEWRDAQSVLDQAKAAFESGDNATALELAQRAQAMARQAIADANSAAPQTFSGSSSYEVVAGDNLWNIAGKGSVYGNPYQWPLIYKANKSQIDDADLIYPGQIFDYEVSPSASDVNAAVQHAKTRGAWSVGSVESSDTDYLAQ